MRHLPETTDQVHGERRQRLASFEPLKFAEIEELRDAVLASGPTMCPGCDGRCSEAAGTKAKLGDLARFYTYHEDHGMQKRRPGRVRRPGRRTSATGKALTSPPPSEACHHKIDFANLLPEVDRLFELIEQSSVPSSIPYCRVGRA